MNSTPTTAQYIGKNTWLIGIKCTCGAEFTKAIAEGTDTLPTCGGC